MLSVTFKTNVLSFFPLSVNEDTSPFPRPSPLSPPVALFIFFLSPSTLLVQSAPALPPLPLAVAPFHPAPLPFLFTFSLPAPPTISPSLSFYHFLTRLPHLSLAPSPSLTYSIFQPCSPAVSSTTF